jgi:hypothetical protein
MAAGNAGCGAVDQLPGESEEEALEAGEVPAPVDCSSCGLGGNVKAGNAGDCGTAPKPASGGFEGSPACCVTTAQVQVSRFGRNGKLGPSGIWLSPGNVCNSDSKYRDKVALCASWSDMSSCTTHNLAKGTAMWCGPGKAVSATDCSTGASECTQDQSGHTSTSNQIALSGTTIAPGTQQCGGGIAKPCPGFDKCKTPQPPGT